jgi:LacI family transcriptional regulator
MFPILVGLYNAGGANSALIERAAAPWPRGREMLFVGHELTDYTRVGAAATASWTWCWTRRRKRRPSARSTSILRRIGLTEVEPDRKPHPLHHHHGREASDLI